MVGGALAPTRTVAVPLRPPPTAVTVHGPPGVAPAVNSPVAEMPPPPATVHAKVGWLAMTAPNWLTLRAVNWRVAVGAAMPAAGVTTIAEAVAVTVTVTVALRACAPRASETTTANW